MSRKDDAVAMHREGFNCAQAVLASCADLCGIDENTAKAVAGGFGGGLRCGEACGAMCGGVMALGLAFPYVDKDDQIYKNLIATLTKKYTAAFGERYGCLACRDLQAAYGGNQICPELIAGACQLAEDMITAANKKLKK